MPVALAPPPVTLQDAAPHAVLDPDDDDTLSDSDAQRKLSHFRRQLQDSSHNSSSIHHLDIRRLIQRAVTTCTLPIILQAATLYLDLLSALSASFDDATLQSCLHYVTRALVDAASGQPCPNKSCSKSTLCAGESHTSMSAYCTFWQKAVSLLTNRKLDIDNADLVHPFVRAFGQLLHHARTPQLLQLAQRALQFLSEEGQENDVTSLMSAIYKAMFPAMLSNLPAQNRNAIVDVLSHVANSELSRRFSRDDDVDVSSPPSSPLAPNHRRASHGSQADDATDCSNPTPPPSPRKSPSGPLLLIPFLKLCFMHVADKSNARESLATVAHRVIACLPSAARKPIFPIVINCSTNPKVPVRLVIVDLTARLLADVSLELPQAVDRALMSSLSARCSDRITSIRAKAIATLTDFASYSGGRLPALLSRRQLITLVSSVSERLCDAKSTVRKSAVDFTGYVCTLSIEDFENGDEGRADLASDFYPLSLVSKLSHRCRDVVATVRLSAAVQMRKAVIFLSSKQDLEEHRIIYESFIEALLPLTGDNDARCRDAALLAMKSFVFGKVSGDEEYNTMSDDVTSSKIQSLFLSILGGDTLSSSSGIRRAIFTLVKEERVDNVEIQGICGMTNNATAVGGTGGAENQKRGAWIVLAVAASAGKAAKIAQWLGREVLLTEIVEGWNVSALKVAVGLSLHMSDDERKHLRDTLHSMVFGKPPGKWTDGEAISGCMEVISCLDGESEGDNLLSECEQLIAGGDSMLDGEVMHALHVIGSICEHVPLEHAPPEAILTFVQAMTANARVDSRLRALALTTVGRICLCETTGGGLAEQHLTANKVGEVVTRRFVPVLVHELDNATSSATRSNAVVVLCDLCRQYTSMVEPFLPRVAGLLCDESRFVRQQTLASVVCLLQEDYIKVRPGLLLFQVARSVLDECSEVRATAEYSLQYVVSEKNESILLVSFVELMLVLNECEKSKTFAHFRRAFESGTRVVGPQHAGERARVYEVVLQSLAPQQRWRLPARMRSDILVEIVEERIDVESVNMQGVLQDCLSLLSSDKVMMAARGATGATGASEDMVAGDEAHAESGSVLRNMQLMELQELTIPLLLQLRHFLQSKRSPLLRDLMQCMCTLLRPHCEKLDQFVSDSGIRSEMEHALKISGCNAGDKAGESGEDGVEGGGEETTQATQVTQ